MAAIIQVTAVTGNYPDGQKIEKALVTYDCELEAAGAASFAVEGRTITGAEVEGDTVILHLNTREEAAALIPKVEPPPRMPGEKPGPPRNMPPTALRPVRVTVTQTGPVQAKCGVIAPDGEAHVSRRAVEPIVEEFTQGAFRGIPYSLYSPRKLEPGREYPLVMYIHDAGPCGPDPKITLAQGYGAIGFAAPAWQAEHPCFVLAPQIDRSVHLTNDDFTCSRELDDIKALLDHIVETNPVDRGRIYATGQSMGCMATCELNIRYPNLFAASLLVAGQWDPERMAQAYAGNNYWILVSEHDRKAFPGMNAVLEALEAAGVKTARYRWDGAAGADQLTVLARDAIMDDVKVRYTVFNASSVVPDGEDDNPGSNHVNTWRVAYTIDGLKEWLFSCGK